MQAERNPSHKMKRRKGEVLMYFFLFVTAQQSTRDEGTQLESWNRASRAAGRSFSSIPNSLFIIYFFFFFYFFVVIVDFFKVEGGFDWSWMTTTTASSPNVFGAKSLSNRSFLRITTCVAKVLFPPLCSRLVESSLVQLSTFFCFSFLFFILLFFFSFIENFLFAPCKESEWCTIGKAEIVCLHSRSWTRSHLHWAKRVLLLWISPFFCWVFRGTMRGWNTPLARAARVLLPSTTRTCSKTSSSGEDWEKTTITRLSICTFGWDSLPGEWPLFLIATTFD